MAEASVQSVERAFRILEELAVSPRGMALSDLSERVALHKSTVHRLLACLIGLGYVVKDSGEGHYRPTFKLLGLSNGMLEDIDVLSAAKPHLDKLSDLTGETVHLLVRDGDQGVYIYKGEAIRNSGTQMRSRVGLRVPLVHTAAGKAMLATGSKEEAVALWSGADHPPITEYTIVRLEDFMGEINRARELGWAMDDQENELGVRCIGTAIPDYTGKAVAAMSLSANATKMTPQRIDELAPLLLACRDAICRDMGVKA